MKTAITVSSLGFAVITVLFLFWTADGPTFVIASEDSEVSNGVNDISLRTVFHFKNAYENIDTFKVFTQVSGWASFPHQFILEGEIDDSKPNLHMATEKSDRGSNYKDFGVNVYLESKGEIYREFAYTSCNIIDYKADTAYNAENAYNKLTQFAYVENFTIECMKLDQNENDHQKLTTEKYLALKDSRTTPKKYETWKSVKLDSTINWRDVYPYPYQEPHK